MDSYLVYFILISIILYGYVLYLIIKDEDKPEKNKKEGHKFDIVKSVICSGFKAIIYSIFFLEILSIAPILKIKYYPNSKYPIDMIFFTVIFVAVIFSNKIVSFIKRIMWQKKR